MPTHQRSFCNRAVLRRLLLGLVGALTALGPVGMAFAADPETAQATSHHIFQWRPFLAPFHAVVLHFPIGFITAACILEIYNSLRPSPELRKVTTIIIWLSLLAGVISAGFGLMRAATGGYDPDALAKHRIFGMSVPVLTLATVILLHVSERDPSKPRWAFAYRGMLSVTLGLLVVAGHYGGNLTHGTEYLIKNAPQFVRDLLEGKQASDARAQTAALDAKRQFYLDKVQPIFSEKCYGCHGSSKQKSSYRLDDPVLALKGGDSGETAIIPGNPSDSFLVKLILLPPQHDDVMPPDGKQPLTLEEIMVLLEWVRDGAVFAEAKAD